MEDHISVLFRQLNVAHRVVVQRYLDQYGLYIGQPRFLFVLGSQPGMSQAALSQELQLSKETVSVTLRRLEHTGYINRVISPEDKRIKLLYLTDKGSALLPDLKQHFADVNQRMFSQLEEKEKELLESLYEKMIQGLGKEL